MRYKIVESFIDKKTCAKLISDAKKYSQNDNLKVLNNRSILPSSGIGFLNLIEKSEVWKKLHEYLNSQSFLKILQKELEIDDKNFLVANFFFNEKPSFLLKKYKTLNSKKISTIGNYNLLFYILFKFYRSIQRKIKYFFTSKKFVEL